MIIDHISRADGYYGMHEGIDIGLRFLAENSSRELDKGRHDLENGVFALVQEYTSKDPAQGMWEGHRKFIDIQYVASGREIVGYADIKRLGIGGYDEEKDFVSAEGEGSRLPLDRGCFMILMPQDMHMPGLAADEPEPVRKIVVKVPV